MSDFGFTTSVQVKSVGISVDLSPIIRCVVPKRAGQVMYAHSLTKREGGSINPSLPDPTTIHKILR